MIFNQDEANCLQRLIHKKNEIIGDEIAVTRPGDGSFFWVDERAPNWMGLPDDHQLSDEVREAYKKI